MTARLKKRNRPRAQFAIAPMIDAVFLMLIYFMVTSSLERQEADIAFQLPGLVEQAEPLEMPDEQMIEITADGRVVVNEFEYDSAGASRLTELQSMLIEFRRTSEANRVEPVVTISPAPEARHQWIVRVMDACSAAGISGVNFALADDF